MSQRSKWDEWLSKGEGSKWKWYMQLLCFLSSFLLQPPWSPMPWKKIRHSTEGHKKGKGGWLCQFRFHISQFSQYKDLFLTFPHPLGIWVQISTNTHISMQFSAWYTHCHKAICLNIMLLCLFWPTCAFLCILTLSICTCVPIIWVRDLDYKIWGNANFKSLLCFSLCIVSESAKLTGSLLNGDWMEFIHHCYIGIRAAVVSFYFSPSQHSKVQTTPKGLRTMLSLYQKEYSKSPCCILSKFTVLQRQ